MLILFFFQPSNWEWEEDRYKEDGREHGGGGGGGMCLRDTSEAYAADGEMVGVWMDGRGQIRGGRRGR